MAIEKSQVINVLKSISVDQGLSAAHSSILKDILINKFNITLRLSVQNPSLQFKNKLIKDIKANLLNVFPSALVTVDVTYKKEAIKVTNKSAINNIIAIASGKGGVGKSTISSNLAISFQKKGYSVGLIDADIYGPSIPLMFDATSSRPKVVEKNGVSLISPIISYGVKIMSIGFFSDVGQAIVWRGPMATKALKQIINQTDWGELDYLFIDLPPGTGDVHLSLVQTIALTGSIIVTTPQPVSLIDAKKAINMFKMKDINVPIIGLVENMSWFEIDNKKHYIFGRDGGKNIAFSEKIELLSELPLDQSIREAGDVGRPASLQKGRLAQLFSSLADCVEIQIKLRRQELSKTKKVEITHNRGCN